MGIVSFAIDLSDPRKMCLWSHRCLLSCFSLIHCTLLLKGQNKKSKIYSQNAHDSDSRSYPQNFSHFYHINQLSFICLSCLVCSLCLRICAGGSRILTLEGWRGGSLACDFVAVCVLGKEACAYLHIGAKKFYSF